MYDHLPTCVAPEGRFVYAVHRPSYTVKNLRRATAADCLGPFDDGGMMRNDANFPGGDVQEPDGGWIYEIPHAFPFRGTTYILKSWADARAQDRDAFVLPEKSPLSFSELARSHLPEPDPDNHRMRAQASRARLRSTSRPAGHSPRGRTGR